ncbi:sulfatase family protein [Maribellus mangrovi]|uniref:sulfatase family protein n=1 Tax=Maribellus mangrovi TaxID=3133146 RepID=UPI0030EF3330
MEHFNSVRTVLLLGITLIIGGILPAQAVSKAGSHPNILIILTDQQTAKEMSCAGNSGLKTPAMDSLATHGIRFTRAYCAQPLCVPSRSSMFTGRMPHEVKAMYNLKTIPDYWSEDLPMMGKMMKKVGYRTGYVGKWHLPVSSKEKNVHGFDYMVEKVYNDYADASIPYDCYEFLKKPGKQPFLLVASFTNPHDICEWARGDQLRQDYLATPPAPEDCPQLPANFEIPENEPDILRKVQSESWKAYPTGDWGPDRWRQYRWAYDRLTETVDSYITRIIASLRKFHKLENTVIIFASDHGDGDASHRWNQKQILYEEVVNVPFIVSWFGKYKNETDSIHLVSTGQDLIPTILDYAGAEEQVAQSGLKGRSVLQLINDKKADWRDYLVVETLFASGVQSSGVAGRAVVTADDKYILYNRGKKKEQYFNLKNDPGEMNDLSGKKDCSKRIAELRDILQNWCREYQDDFDGGWE